MAEVNFDGLTVIASYDADGAATDLRLDTAPLYVSWSIVVLDHVRDGRLGRWIESVVDEAGGETVVLHLNPDDVFYRLTDARDFYDRVSVRVNADGSPWAPAAADVEGVTG